jgi:pteridine reductase
MQQLEGRVALVTGAARRLGRAIALKLAAAGCNVIVHYRSSSAQAEELCRIILDNGGKATTLHGELRGENECNSLIERAAGLFGRLDIVVNNASVYTQAGFDASEQTYMDVLMTNALAPLFISRAFAERCSDGCVVNMLDSRISGYDSSHVPYYFSKRLLCDITENMAAVYAPRIRFNAVAPGLILPPEGKGEEYLERLSAGVPLRRHGSEEDIAEAVLFLIRSDFITGQVIYVDGGQHLSMHLFSGRN